MPSPAGRRRATLAFAALALTTAAAGRLTPPSEGRAFTDRAVASTVEVPTTTAPRPPTTTPAPPPTATPTAAPMSPPTGDPGGSGVARAQAALDGAVPAVWRSVLAPRIEEIGGTTSWANTDGSLRFGSFHLGGPWQHLRTVMAHELGHLVAFRYGSQAFLGAAPAGFPYTGSHPEEMWADCVARTFTGNIDPSHGLTPCDGDALGFARAFLAGGPEAHRRTG
jgi:hypothetical protein